MWTETRGECHVMAGVGAVVMHLRAKECPLIVGDHMKPGEA